MLNLMTDNNAVRKPWLAGLLGILTPGLGQLYNGQKLKAISFFLLIAVVPSVIFLLLAVTDWSIILAFAAVMPALIIVLYIYSILDAVMSARSINPTFQPKYYNQI